MSSHGKFDADALVGDWQQHAVLASMHLVVARPCTT